MQVYLCGPIHGCTDAQAKNWREYVKLRLRACLFDYIDPMRRDYRGREHSTYREIVELDKRDIRNSDVVMASCPQPSYGTAMEIHYAWTLGKPVVVVCPTAAATSPWLLYHVQRIFHSYDDAMDWIKEIDNANA